MKIPIYQIDAFAEKPFQGNPAAVCPLERWLPDTVLQAIAEENALSETAFYVPGDGFYELRWFSPVKEVALCGHATLAAAAVIFSLSALSEVVFQSRGGELRVSKANEILTLDFPLQTGTVCEPPPALIEGLGAQPVEVLKAMDYMAVFETENDIVSMRPDFLKLSELDLRGVIVTAPGDSVDFVSRFFAPNYGINEDPVTGSAHCTLAPYWAEKLGVNPLSATQLSKRSGALRCEVKAGRVFISGKAQFYLQGEIDC